MKRWLLLAGVLGCSPHSVVRMIDGVPTEGMFITDRAYAAYLWGSELEARERPDEALAAYDIAVSFAPDSVELWVRIGSIRCALGQTDEAAEAFDEAEERDASYEPLWRGRAECALRRERLAEALAHAERAHREDPARVETVLLYARLLDAAGRREDAARYLRSLTVRHPHRVDVWQGVADHAEASDDAMWKVEAAERLGALTAGEPSARRSTWNIVDAALSARDLEAARRALLHARLDPRALPARAILLARPALAANEAELRLAADPDDAGARVALALALDLLGDGSRSASVLAELPPSTAGLDDSGRALLAELLWRRAGAAAAALVFGRPVTSTRELRTTLRESFAEG